MLFTQILLVVNLNPPVPAGWRPHRRQTPLLIPVTPAVSIIVWTLYSHEVSQAQIFYQMYMIFVFVVKLPIWYTVMDS